MGRAAPRSARWPGDDLSGGCGRARRRSGSEPAPGRHRWRPAASRRRRRAEVTYAKHIAPDPAAQLRELPPRRRRGADGAADLRAGAAVGAQHQDAHRHRAARRGDAAVVHGKGHRHPALQERPVAQRRGDRPHRASGPTPARRAATRPTCRRRGCGTTAPAGRSATPDLVVRTSRHPGQGRRARLVGRDPADAHRPHRGPLRGGARSARGQRRRLRAAPAARPSAGATCSTT